MKLPTTYFLGHNSLIKWHMTVLVLISIPMYNIPGDLNNINLFFTISEAKKFKVCQQNKFHSEAS
jgi:hypothetical protein